MQHKLMLAGGCLSGIVLSVILTFLACEILMLCFHQMVSDSDFSSRQDYASYCKKRGLPVRRATLCCALAVVATSYAVIGYFFGFNSGVACFTMYFAAFCSLSLKSA
jgi:hypothetical protein